MDTPLKALIINCSLKPSSEASSTERLASEVAAELMKLEVACDTIRAVDYAIKPGVEIDMGEGDDWPSIRAQMLEADIFVLATPTWVGHMSSVAQRIIERLDGELSESDDKGRHLTFGKVGAVVIVGNEDGAHKISGDVFQSLNDVGFTLPANAVTYWNGETMSGTDYKDLDETPEAIAGTTKTLAVNAAHLARLLKTENYPPVS